MKKKSLFLVIFMLGLTLLVGACAPMTGSEAVEDKSTASSEYEMPQEEAMAEGVGSDRNYTSGTGESASAVERMMIYNANLEIAVEDPASAMESVIEMAEDAGGFVVSSNIYQAFSEAGGTQPRANVTVRVPAGELDLIMAEIKALTPNPEADVLSENVSGQDVTAEYTDLESRLRNFEAAEEALVELMEKAEDPEDVLNIFDELTYYRGEIEVVKGRMKYIEESVDLSAISVEIVTKESLQPIEIGGWQPKGTAKKAIQALINAAQFLADALIWFGIFCLPFLIPLSIVIYFLVRLIQKKKAKKAAQKRQMIEKSEKET
ncbi:MAG: DUF4349 domain-containing protein [Chloroflexota bacterium]|jgi:hypothetical protein|nr:DUF4349 domain-containing protein [Chloroflexota bacterium]